LRPTHLRSIQLISYQELATFCERTKVLVHNHHHNHNHHHHHHHHNNNYHHRHHQWNSLRHSRYFNENFFRKLLLKFGSISAPTSFTFNKYADLYTNTKSMSLRISKHCTSNNL
jgi:hypothetical protein